ncbi:MAG TPA: hypothetical protein PK098_12025 [Phycisphaerales bacterium]|nr:hypothetical protein [Phycisphaerales bacterium]
MANYEITARTMKALPAASDYVRAYDININGIVVGSNNSVSPEFKSGAGISATGYGHLWNLATGADHVIDPQGGGGFAWAINDLSPPVIIGAVDYPTFPGFSTWRGFRIEYNGPSSPLHLLSPTAGSPEVPRTSHAFGVGHDGTAIGYGQVVCGGGCFSMPDCQFGQYWQSAAGSVLEAVIATGSSRTIGRGMNSSGHVIGSSSHNFGLGGQCKAHAAFWPSVGGTPVPLPPDDRETSGYAIAAPFTNGELHAVGVDWEQNVAMLWRRVDTSSLWEPPILSDVNVGGNIILCGQEGWERLYRAYDINDHGWIVGAGQLDADGFFAHRGFVMIPSTYCTADLNGDFIVDVLDLLILLSAWGLYTTTHCFGSPDINNSDVVDVQDLLILLGAWGPCPGMGIEVMTLNEQLTAAGLTGQQWNDYQSIMTGSSSQATKDNWTCWIMNYLMQCKNCPLCPGRDPFAN